MSVRLLYCDTRKSLESRQTINKRQGWHPLHWITADKASCYNALFRLSDEKVAFRCDDLYAFQRAWPLSAVDDPDDSGLACVPWLRRVLRNVSCKIDRDAQ